MIRVNYHAPGTAPGTLMPRVTQDSKPPLITLIQYDADTIYEGIFETFQELLTRYDPEKVNWINIDGLTDITLLREVGDHFKIHPLALEDVLNTTQRPKVEHFENHYFIVSEMIYFAENSNLTVEQLSLFLGKSYVLTLQEESGMDVFEKVRVRLRTGSGFARKMKSDYLAYALLDSMVDQFFPILEAVGETIEEIEEELLERPTRSTLRRLHESKRLLMQLRRAAWPQREIFGTLIRDDAALVNHDTQIFLRDCYDHITQIIDILENYRDLAAGLMDVYLSSLGFRTNEIMRVLTLASVFFMPLTFLAGVYGMNFDTASRYNMPELLWPYGYLFFWAVCLIIVVTMFIFFKRKKWL